MDVPPLAYDVDADRKIFGMNAASAALIFARLAFSSANAPCRSGRRAIASDTIASTDEPSEGGSGRFGSAATVGFDSGEMPSAETRAR